MASEAKARTIANRLLGKSLLPFHLDLPIETINEALRAAGLREMEPAIYCGREGRVHEQVGERSWIAFNWYKHDSGRYEIVAYVS